MKPDTEMLHHIQLLHLCETKECKITVPNAEDRELNKHSYRKVGAVGNLMGKRIYRHVEEKRKKTFFLNKYYKNASFK